MPIYAHTIRPDKKVRAARGGNLMPHFVFDVVDGNGQHHIETDLPHALAAVLAGESAVEVEQDDTTPAVTT